MEPRRALICGSNYGTSYLRALADAPDRYTVAGILARGSERSLRTAEKLNVPLFTAVAGVPDDVDLACAALGTDAHPVVLELLERGIPVLCEHPLSAEFVQSSLAAARASGAPFHVNGHWSELDASRAFIEHAQVLRRSNSVQLQLTVSDRSLYGVLDILRRALSGLRPVTLDVAGRDEPFTILHGTMGPCPITLRIECSRRRDGTWLEDASSEYQTCYRVTVESPTGSLSLLGPCGPVVWNTNENRVTDVDLPLWSSIYVEGATKRSLSQQRLAANLRSVDALAREAAGGETPAEQQPDYLMDVSGAWDDVARTLRQGSGFKAHSEP